ncbi:serine phosphatase RsbU (regulator of sigma subunit) [Kitasatospora sp. MAA4]|uniref:PP2C family protein-serine/threonine phosphatase n=1 Tax=Kitasatospora sp. MAA4 TaxID=3035093 RepID=UPI0024755146|nr:PP2C family protein-serine/threonine phosphatase [Kitasatospora sp. MAA4]MDH6135376.1 serine phosphatase RsbU (regulator of sigma subunit) [Kitasatospora sp. MAA4]
MPATGDGRAPSAAHRPGAAAGVLATRRSTAAGRPSEFPGSLPVSRPTPPSDTESRVGHGEAAPIPRPRATTGGTTAGTPEAPFRLLVIENDASDAALIAQLVTESYTPIELHWANGIEQAAAQLSAASASGRRGRPRAAGFSCVLLDLAAPAKLPSSDGEAPGTGTGTGIDSGTTCGPDALDGPGGLDQLDGLRELLRRAPNTAVVVLTDAAASDLGAAAVAAGAQDFLVKHETDGPLLARALRYAVERKRADESQRRLVEAELRGQENARLQRHLLPTPLLDGARLSFTRRYRPGRSRALLGGDFYDAVRTDDGTVHVVIGDVCGHGPDEAALGVALRIAWRTLVFAGLTGQALLTTLQHVLEHERRSDEIFATLCMVVLSPGPTEAADTARAAGTVGAADAAGIGGQRGGARSATRSAAPAEHARLYLAGHPSPLLLSPEGSPALLPFDQAGPALGLLACDDGQAVWPAHEVELPPGWGLLLYTDGLVEGRVGTGSSRLGQEGLIDLIGSHQAAGLTRGRLVDSAIAQVEELNGGALTDDVAVLLLERAQTPLIMG